MDTHGLIIHLPTHQGVLLAPINPSINSSIHPHSCSVTLTLSYDKELSDVFCQIHFTIMKLSSCRCKAFINWPIIIIITVEKRISTFITSLIDFYWPVWLLFSCWWIEKNFLEGMITEGVCKKENSDTIPWLHYNIYKRLSVNADRPDRDLWAVFKPILCEYICQWVSV